MANLRMFTLALLLLASSSSNARMAQANPYVGSMGIGVMFNPSLFLLNPQIEYFSKRNFAYGISAQLGLGSLVFLGTATGTARWRFDIRHPNWHPSAELGLGMAFASAGFLNEFGVHMLMGGGVEYQVTSDIAVGTTLRFNFAPPLQTFFFSWPIFQGRFSL